MATKILVAGSGSIGRRHAENLAALGADVSLKGWRGYSLNALEADLAEHDALVVATATDIRLAPIEIAAQMGKPLYIEKPLAFTSAEVEAIAEATAPVAERSMLGYMMRYHPAFRKLAQTDLSDVFQFSFAIGHDVNQWRANWRFSESYAARATGGGVLLDLCHELDMASTLFPGLTPVTVEAQGHVAYPGVDVASRISLRNAQVTGEVCMDYLTPRLHRRGLLRGTRASHDFDFASQSYTTSTLEAVSAHELPLERNAMFMAISADFLALVEGRAPSSVEHLPRLDLALPSARLVANCWQSRQFIGTLDKELP